MKGVEICGGGKWADIKRLGFREIASRSPVDLKDKWRNLLRVALLPVEQIRLKKVSLFGSSNLLIPICATCRGQDGPQWLATDCAYSALISGVWQSVAKCFFDCCDGCLGQADNRHNLPLELLQHVKELAREGEKQPKILHGCSSRRSVRDH